MKNGFYCTSVFVILTLYVNTYSQGSWGKIVSPTDQLLRTVSFVDSLYGWAAGDSGTVIHTTNGGNIWDIQDVNSIDNIVDIFFLNRNCGWALTWSLDTLPFKTILLSTTDGGLNWASNPYKEDEILMNCILFLDSLNGWMGGSPHALVRTMDGGTSWEQAVIDSTTFAFFPVLNIKFFNSQYGYACGGHIDVAGVTWRTSNGGNTWYPIRPENAPADPIQEIQIIDSVYIVGIGGDIEGLYGIDVIRTSDGGLFWNYQTITYRGVAYDLDFRTETEVWAPIASGKVFIVSTDTGYSWNQIPTPDSISIYNITFPDSLHGFAVGEGGTVLRYVPPVINLAEELRPAVPTDFLLEQNFPNPFNSSTRIKFSIQFVPSSIYSVEDAEDIAFVTLKVFDIIGNEVEALVDQELSTGEYYVEFDGNRLPSGIYFYQLRMNARGSNIYDIDTKKMILLK